MSSNKPLHDLEQILEGRHAGTGDNCEPSADYLLFELKRVQAISAANACEVLEVKRAFEKFGLSRLLVSANGTESPHLAVLRVLQWLSDKGLINDMRLL